MKVAEFGGLLWDGHSMLCPYNYVNIDYFVQWASSKMEMGIRAKGRLWRF
jgi:hypothetical protein